MVVVRLWVDCVAEGCGCPDQRCSAAVVHLVEVVGVGCVVDEEKVGHPCGLRTELRDADAMGHWRKLADQPVARTGPFAVSVHILCTTYQMEAPSSRILRKIDE